MTHTRYYFLPVEVREDLSRAKDRLELLMLSIPFYVWPSTSCAINTGLRGLVLITGPVHELEVNAF
jgi:hypothetical protein